MKLNIKEFIYALILTFIIALVIHLLIFHADKHNLGINLHILFEIYGFLLFINVSHFFLLRKIFIKWKTFAGFLFIALSFIKMGMCILYLAPYIYPSGAGSTAIALNFMAIYFVLLFFEIVYLTKQLQKNI